MVQGDEAASSWRAGGRHVPNSENRTSMTLLALTCHCIAASLASRAAAAAAASAAGALLEPKMLSCQRPSACAGHMHPRHIRLTSACAYGLHRTSSGRRRQDA
jgi:hypothetical protein